MSELLRVRRFGLRIAHVGLAVSCAASAAAVEVEIVGSFRPSTSVTVVATAADGVEVRREATCPGRVDVPLDTGRVWSFTVSGDWVWAASESIYVRDGDEAVSLRVLPAAPLRGRLVVPEGETTPEELTVSVSAAPMPSSPEATPTAELPQDLQTHNRCSLDGQEGFQCAIPVGRVDLKLRAPRYLSVFAWDVDIGPGGLDLGEVALEPGASIVVPVVGRDRQPTPDAAVGLEWVAHNRSSPRASDVNARTNSRGLAVIEGVPPGTWRVEVSKPGLVASRAPVVRVPSRTEVSVPDPVVMSPPVTLNVSVEPPADPFGRPWSLGLNDPVLEGPESVPVPARTTDAGGWAHWTEIPPGEYELDLRDSRGGLWRSEPVDLRETPPPVLLEVEPIRVVGRVDNLPEDGRFLLQWRRRASGTSDLATARVGLTSEGGFETALARPGTWIIELLIHNKGRLSLGAVEVPTPRSPEAVEIELTYPPPRITGRVLDPRGQPVELASASAMFFDTLPAESESGSWAAPETAQVPSDEKGRFSIHSATTGKVSVTATGPGGGEATVEVTTDDSGPVDVELVLSPPGTLRGVVVRDGRPLIGATLCAWAHPPTGGAMVTTRSDSRGRFELSLGRQGPAMLTIVPQTGGADFTTVIVGDEDVVIDLDPTYGTLTLQWDRQRAESPMLKKDNVMIPAGLLLMMSGGALTQSGQVTLPPLVADRYEVCVSRGGPPSEGSACQFVDVLPFGHETVDLRPVADE